MDGNALLIGNGVMAQGSVSMLPDFTSNCPTLAGRIGVCRQLDGISWALWELLIRAARRSIRHSIAGMLTICKYDNIEVEPYMRFLEQLQFQLDCNMHCAHFRPQVRDEYYELHNNNLAVGILCVASCVRLGAAHHENRKIFSQKQFLFVQPHQYLRCCRKYMNR
jgi:hypothetical protein